MQQPASIRQGNRSEWLAQYILSAFAVTTPVPRQEDLQGVDFHCSLLRRQDGVLIPFAPFNVQIKSDSVTSVAYGGETRNGVWRKHELDAIKDYSTPFFIGIVDKRCQKLDLYQTINRLFLWSDSYPFQVDLVHGDCDQIGSGNKTSCGRGKSGCDERVIWKLPIGPPVISITADESEVVERVEAVKSILHAYIEMDQNNIVRRRVGLVSYEWPLMVKTNSHLGEIGLYAASASSPETVLEIMTPALASLLSAYKHSGDKDAILAWEAVCKLLPRSQKLAFQGSIIDEAIRFAKS